MLDNKLIKKIENFISIEPRNINEISKHINKNWRTTDRYIKQIEEDQGTINTKTFREGTRGALKIAYIANPEKISTTKFQEELEQQIYNSKKKEDFSPFDIFQHIDEKYKRVIIEEKIDETSENLIELQKLIESAKKEIKLFSGNLSWINLKKGKFDLFKSIESLVKDKIRIKILTRIDLEGVENIKKILSLNYKYGDEFIEIKHCNQPLRAFLIDDKIVRIKEIKEPTGKLGELDKKIYIFYTIKDLDWTKWLGKIFIKLFNTAIGSNKRLNELDKLMK